MQSKIIPLLEALSIYSTEVDKPFPIIEDRDEIYKIIFSLTSTALNFLAAGSNAEDRAYAENHSALTAILNDAEKTNSFLDFSHNAIRSAFCFGTVGDFKYLQKFFELKMPGVAANKILTDMFFGRNFIEDKKSRLDHWVSLILSNPSIEDTKEWISFIEDVAGHKMPMAGAHDHAFNGPLLTPLITLNCTVEQFELILPKHKDATHSEISNILYECCSYKRMDILDSILKLQRNWLNLNMQPYDDNSFTSRTKAFTSKFHFILSQRRHADVTDTIQWAAENMFNPATEMWMLETMREILNRPSNDSEPNSISIGSMMLSGRPRAEHSFITAMLNAFERQSLLFHSSSAPHGQTTLNIL